MDMSPKDYIQNYLLATVPPCDTNNLEIEQHKNYFLNKHKPVKNILKVRRRQKYITRKEKRELNLTTLNRNSFKFDEIKNLHKLWKEYISDFLELKHYKKIPTIEDKNWEHFSGLLLKADYHGAIFTVKRSTCPSLIGHSGICVKDTKEILSLVGDDNITRHIPKMCSVFELHLNALKITIFGKQLAYRSADRATKKIKVSIVPDL